MTLEIRPVTSAEDRLTVLRVAYSAAHDYGDPSPFEQYAGRRLSSARRKYAAWWLAELGGEPVASLVCYELTFKVRDRIIAGYGLGGVSTHRDHRRRGFASALCDAVAKNAESQGRPVGLLFSAVPPGIYENLGFHVTPGVMSKCTQLEALAKSGPKAKPVPIDPRRAMDRLEDWYSNFHGQALHLYRDEAGWHRNLECNPSDLFFALGDNGYVRLWDSGSLLEVCELVVPENEIAPVLRWAADIAHQLGRDGLTGWWRPPTELRTLVDDLGRAKTLPMVRGDVPSEGFHAWSSDYF